MQSQSFLSSLGISTADCQTQADDDAKLAAVLLCFQAMKTGTYASPSPAPRDPMAIYNVNAIIAHDNALWAMQAAVRSGNLTVAHQDCDQVNSLDSNDPVVNCGMPDINILANDFTSWNGTVARQILGGTITLFNDMANAATLIAAGEAITPAPPPPPPAGPPIVIYLPGPLPGFSVGQSIAAPGGALWVYSFVPFGNNNAGTYMLVRTFSNS